MVFPAEAAPAAVLLLGVPGQGSAVDHPAVTHRPAVSAEGSAVTHGLEPPWLRAGHKLQLGLVIWESHVSQRS